MAYASRFCCVGASLITHLLAISPTAMWENVFLLILTAIVKVGLTAWTFGMMVRAQ
jgi:hypothetical protein